MKIPSVLSSKPAVRTAAMILDDIGRLQGDRDAAARELDRLGTLRPGILLDGSDADLEAHDATRARTQNQHDRAVAQIERAEGEYEAALTREEAERRQALYAAGRKACAEREKLILGDYAQTAAKLAAIARRARDLGTIIADANKALPPGAEPIGPGEPSNGKPPIAGHYEQAPAIPTPYDSRTGKPLEQGARGPHVEWRDVEQPPRWIEPFAGTPHYPILARLRLPDVNGLGDLV